MRIELGKQKPNRKEFGGDYKQAIYVWDGERYHLWGRISTYRLWTINKVSADLLPCSIANATHDEICDAVDQADDESLRPRVQRYVVHLDDDFTKTGDPACTVFEVAGWWGADNSVPIVDLSEYGEYTSAKHARTAMIEWIHEQFDPTPIEWVVP